MKSTRPGAAIRIYTTLCSAWTTIAFLAAIFVLLLLSLGIGQEATATRPLSEVYSPGALYWLRRLGLTEIFGSGWFIFVTVGLSMNLLCMLVNRAPAILSVLKSKPPRAIDPHAASVALPSQVARETFRETVQELGRRRLGRLTRLVAVRDEGGLNELLLYAERGRLGAFALPLACVGAVLALTGMYLERRSGIHGEVVIEERQRTSLVRVLSGDAEAAGRWQIIEDDGAAASWSGFSRMDFELWLEGFDPVTRTATLVLFKDGRTIASGRAARGRPFVWEGLSWIPINQHKSGKFSARLIVRDRQEQEPERVVEANRGEIQSAPGGKFQVIDAREEIEGLGAAAQIELTETGKSPVQFWVFEKAPDFDAVHRKNSRPWFLIQSVVPRYEIALALRRSPGAPLLLLAASSWIIAAILGFWVRRERWWFSWQEGRVLIAGIRDEEPGFGPALDQMTRALFSRLGKHDASLRGQKWEVRRAGS